MKDDANGIITKAWEDLFAALTLLSRMEANERTRKRRNQYKKAKNKLHRAREKLFEAIDILEKAQ